MTLGTSIEWCDATFNPWWGCERVSPGCAHCYADTLARRYGHGDTWGTDHGFRFFGDKHWQEPLKWARTLPAKLGRRPRVFCASMADVFEDRDELIPHRVRLYDLILRTPELDWLILTKRPEFARSWLDRHAVCSAIAYRYAFNFEDGDNAWDYAYEAVRTGPKNVWMGVSIENARFTYRADVLREIPAAVRFISAEPLLGSLFIGGGERDAPVAPTAASSVPRRAPLNLAGIDWIIVGGESGPKARPFDIEHAREILRAASALCDSCSRAWGDGLTKTPPSCTGRPALFVKQLGSKPFEEGVSMRLLDAYGPTMTVRDRKGGDWNEWPADLRVREFPAARA